MAVLARGGVALAISEPSLYHARGCFALGWGLYLLEEHLIHRFVFHAPAPQNQFLFDLLYRLHYGHHDQQRSRHLLFTPLWFALPIALVTIGRPVRSCCHSETRSSPCSAAASAAISSSSGCT